MRTTQAPIVQTVLKAIDKVTNILVLTQRHITVVQRIQETMESPQLQYTEKKADVPAEQN